MDWVSRAVLAWRLSNTMDVWFCVSALEEALVRFGRPEIFNTDQGRQFTSAVFTSRDVHRPRSAATAAHETIREVEKGTLNADKPAHQWI
jgi:transposase InsO family protein